MLDDAATKKNRNMKTTIQIEKEVELRYLKIKAGARYWEDATVNGVENENGDLIPLRDGDYWCATIDIDKGIVLDWTQGVEAKIHYKVCDDGEYWLLDENKKEILYKEGYVPDIADPYNDSYGDYIILNIDVDGKISGWKLQEDVSDFEPIK